MIFLLILIGAIGLIALFMNAGARDRAAEQKDFQYRTLRLQDPDTYKKLVAQDEKRMIATILFWLVVISIIVFGAISGSH